MVAAAQVQHRQDATAVLVVVAGMAAGQVALAIPQAHRHHRAITAAQVAHNLAHMAVAAVAARLPLVVMDRQPLVVLAAQAQPHLSLAVP